MYEQFARFALLFGEEALEKLSGARVAVFGAGGVGGNAIETLARSGVGTIDIIDDDDSYDDAVAALYEGGYIPFVEETDSPVPAVDLAYLYSRLWNIKGGLMYRITNGAPRYAFKQFQADGVLSSKQEPSDIVSGAKALSIYTSCVKKYSDFDIKSVSMESE